MSVPAALTRCAVAVLLVAAMTDGWAAAAPTAEIVMQDGAPTLMINGERRMPIIYRENLPHAKQEQGIAHYAAMADAGVDLFVFPMGIGVTQTREQRESSWRKYTDPGIARMLEVTGERSMVVLLVTTTLLRQSHKAWADEHPDQMMVWPPAMSPGNRVSVSSRLWQEMAAEGLRDLVAHVQSSGYADRVAGYFLCGGGGEWLDYWDYSPVERQQFREWLSRRYDGDEARLRSAWGDEKASFDSVELPAWDDLFRADLGLFHDPARSRRLPDYFEFYHEELADAASALAGSLKDAVDGDRLVGLWNGYFLFPGWSPPERGIFRRRQGAFDKLLADPNIDFFVAPYSYRERGPGGAFLPQFLCDSMRLHGKLAITEDDTRTFLVPSVEARYDPAQSKTSSVTIGDNFGLAASLDETVAVMKRNFAACCSKSGHGWWWYSMGDEGGWYDHPALLDTVRRLCEIAEDRLRDDPPAAEIAVIVSNRSLWHMKFTPLVDDLLIRQMTEGLARLGAPFEVYLDTDLKHPSFPFDRFKLLVFLNTFHLDADQRRIIADRVQARGRTVLTVFAPGFVDDRRLALDGVREITGMDMAMAPVTFTKGLQVVVNDFAHPMTSSLPRDTRFGTTGEIGPIIWCADPDATALGELVGTDISGGVATLRKSGGLCVKDMGDWVSVWSGAPNLPSSLLRGIARSAGVHIYDDGDDVVYAGRGLLAIHTRYAGQRALRLPSPCDVYDPFADKLLAEGATEIAVDLPSRGTFLALLTPR